jgi:hypothetical protein
MHYILDGKYDLIFYVEAVSEYDARLKADRELEKDGLLQRAEFREIS